ncbi:hypothetical protein E1B28_000692 [Marasmius oreades]|uniref:Zn(2)-C6 fungal-type domain-containing protein n=1 Tax=Marasmius oreades TaxID=181124 RepID=A0A9P7V1U5_9AGAR|nr:uncharacterized protein E1B28_000692 [Marasmius oreades]KAG7098785.1 hypothetical protein E1B28_000692 [Marasmius oreades]
MSYSQPHYLPPPQQQYYTASPQLTNGQSPHHPPPSMRQETTAQRKRPKYTRSKTGCMTCRVKKIKCDETKPNCMRCTHGQRDCTWPEGVPAKRKTTSRKDSVDGGPSTANSSISDGSTPPIRERTPPRIQSQSLDAGIPPLISRRSQDSYLQLAPLPPNEPRRQGRFAYSQPSSSSSHLLPDIAPNPYHPSRYESPYTPETLPSSRGSSGTRPIDHHHPLPQWNPQHPQLPPPPTMLPSLSSVDHHSYYNIPPPRNILDSTNDRYQ